MCTLDHSTAPGDQKYVNWKNLLLRKMGSVEEVYRSMYETSTTIEIHVSCTNLPSKDLFSKSDPMVVLFIEERNSATSWKELGRTEVIRNNNSPRFLTPFRVEYHFEELQKLKFEVYDSDSQDLSLKKHDYLGHIVISLGNLVGEHCGKMKKTLLGCTNKNNIATITFLAEELTDSKEIVTLKFHAENIDKKDTFGQSDAFLVVSRQGADNSEYLPVHQTEVVKGTLNPSWEPFDISVASLCNADRNRPIKIECFDWDVGSNDFIGECEITLGELESEKASMTRDLINPKKKQHKKNYENSGLLRLINFEMGIEPSFLDYITGGLDLCFHVAVDLSLSNGHPTTKDSYHYMAPSGENQYLQALSVVGHICEDYDTDKLIPAYGFGVEIDGKNVDQFNLNGTDNADCSGIAGVIEAYKNFLHTAKMSESVNFGPVVDLVTKFAEEQKVLKKYHILLILTAGCIKDMEDTKRAIIEASKYPVSIIIVGVGEAQFDAMDELDCDKSKLTHNGRVAERDIVQFVPFRNFSGEFQSHDLAKEVLFEVPYQLVSYMNDHGVKPQAV